VLEIGGERHTMNELAEALSAQAGATKPVRHVSRRALRTMSAVARPISPFLARVAPVALLMDTVDLGSPAVDARLRMPDIPRTTLAEILAARSAVDAAAQPARRPAPAEAQPSGASAPRSMAVSRRQRDRQGEGAPVGRPAR
jgi:hypothetical protein